MDKISVNVPKYCVYCTGSPEEKSSNLSSRFGIYPSMKVNMADLLNLPILCQTSKFSILIRQP